MWAAGAIADIQRFLPGVWFPGDDMVDRLVNLPARDDAQYDVLHKGTGQPDQFLCRPLLWQKYGLFHPLHVICGRARLCSGSDRTWVGGGR